MNPWDKFQAAENATATTTEPTVPSGQMPWDIYASGIDRDSGAPASVRMRVGNANPQDRLATLQQYYPEALPYGDNNFLFVDPVSKRRTLYNPSGPDFGDVASEGKSITMGVASSLGAAAGAGLGLLTGPGAPLTVPQAGIAGAGLGNAVGRNCGI